MPKTYLGYLRPDSNQITKQYVTPCPPHNHYLWELIFFFDGIATTAVNDKIYDVSSGDVFLIGPPHLHEIALLSTPHLHQDVYFTEGELKQTLKALPKTFQEEILSGKRIIHLKLSGDNYGSAQSYCENILKFSLFDNPLGEGYAQEYQKFLSHSLLNWIIGLYVIHYSNRHTQMPKWLLELVNELQRPEVFSQRVNDIVSSTNYSHSQVGTVFKNSMGISLVDYLINVRMNYARELLEATDKSVLTISAECGYNSLSTFIKTFREKNGCSPLQYRKKQKQEALINFDLVEK